jgi:CheY-like chemotaxis protein
MPNVLIVDDDLEGCEPVAKAIERMGHKVSCAANGREALAALVGPGDVDLVILDIRMPGMDGIKLLEILRSYLRWHKMPVILLSAYVNEEHTRQARLMGVWHVFHKAQYQLPDLLAAVNELTADGADRRQP